MSNFNIKHVSTFKGFDVVNGEMNIHVLEYIDFLNDVYEPVTICGMEYDQGNALEAIDPVAFRCGLSDYESEIQSELQEAIDNEDESDIEWIDGMEPKEEEETEE